MGSVERISLEERTIDIKKRKDTAAVHPEAVFAHNVIGTTVLAEALARIGGVGRGSRDRRRRATYARPREPPAAGAAATRRANPSDCPVRPLWPRRCASRRSFDGGVLPIQGPPGTGKTHIGARMICALVKSGAESRDHGDQPQGHPQSAG